MRELPSSPEPLARPRVLLVDGDAQNRELYAAMLERYALVLTADLTENALVIASRTPLDAIILHVTPAGIGLDLCVRLKRDPATRDLPIVILSAEQEHDPAGEARLAGASAFLTTPCRLERLVRAVDAVIRSAQARGAAPSANRHTPFVLIVDPDTQTVARLRSRLASARYAVATAATFLDGMRVLRAMEPDLLIAALRLGEYNGLQYVAARERPLQAIVIGEGRFEAREAYAFGAEFVERPVDVEALMPLIQRLAPAAPHVAPTRRWIRKRVTQSVAALVGRARAELRDVSYGGVCLAIDGVDATIPTAVDITFPDVQQTVHAQVVWRGQTDDHTWLCGAQIPILTDAWQNLVDAIS